jgi:hypothetical protein
MYMCDSESFDMRLGPFIFVFIISCIFTLLISFYYKNQHRVCVYMSGFISASTIFYFMTWSCYGCGKKRNVCVYIYIYTTIKGRSLLYSS